MLAKIKAILRRKNGEVAIDTSITLIAFTAILAFSLSFYPVVTRVQIQNIVADELARYIEVRGEAGSVADSEFARLKQSASIADATFSVNADFIAGTQKIPLEGPFEVTIISDADIGVGGIFKVTVPITSKAAGRGERYWK